RFSPDWPRAGTTRNGIAYRLPPSAPLTAATESSSSLLIPTPTAWLGHRPVHADGDPDRWTNPERSNELSDFLAWKMLPTPRASADQGAEPLYQDEHHDKIETRLRRLADEPLLPTPTSRQDSRNATHPRDENDQGHSGTTLMDAALISTGANTSPQSEGGKS